jgi:hypothetical protein
MWAFLQTQRKSANIEDIIFPKDADEWFWNECIDTLCD